MERAQLSAARHRLQLSLEEVAVHVGVNRATVHRWEKKGDIPQPYHLRKLCDLYSVPAKMLGFQEEDTIDIASMRDLENTEEDAAITFQEEDITLRLMRIVWIWLCHNARYHELQMLIILELEDNNFMSHDEMSRRDALRRLATMPITMFGLTAFSPVLNPTGEILAQCAAGITACCYLSKQKELAFVSSIVSKYIPTLKEIVRRGSIVQQKAAADLLAQCLLLRSTLSKHVTSNTDAVSYAQQAEKYSEIAENPLLRIAAVRMQDTAYWYANNQTQALQAAEKARYLLQEATHNSSVPPRLSSYIYAGLASDQAYHGRKQDALRSLQKAHSSFNAQPTNEPLPGWIHHSEASLFLNDGIAHQRLNMPKEAAAAFTRVTTLSVGAVATRTEALINQAITELSRDDQPRDMEWCIDQWTQGIEGAKTLKSEQWFNEATQVYMAMRAAWPGEQRVKDLREQVAHW